MITDLAVGTAGIVIAACALFYGCIRVHPASLVRWVVYLAVAIIAVEFAAIPLLAPLGITMPTIDQVVAIAGMTFAFDVLMERILPWWL